jgi:hypothetical protein
MGLMVPLAPAAAWCAAGCLSPAVATTGIVFRASSERGEPLRPWQILCLAHSTKKLGFVRSTALVSGSTSVRSARDGTTARSWSFRLLVIEVWEALAASTAGIGLV